MISVFVFPGQGSQRKGMGADLFKKFPELTEISDSILGFSIQELCIEDPDELLVKTEYTQPALFVVNELMYKHETEVNENIPDFIAGHSLGELNALLAAGVFDFETGLKIVKKRGELMSKSQNGSMAAVIGLDCSSIENIILDNDVTSVNIANYNSPKQTVISGRTDDIKLLIPRIKHAGARLVIRLNVSGAFHSCLMRQAQTEFSDYIGQFEFNSPQVPVISNFKAIPYESDLIHDTLANQMSNPVRWTESIQYLLQLGEAEFKETGPGNVLTGLIRQIT